MKHRTALAILALTFAVPCLAQNQQPKPATLRSLLLHELHTTHNVADWFVPISVAVDGLPAEQASWQPPNGGHSAGQLTYHLLFWNRRNLQRLKGETVEKFGGNNDETFEKFDDKQWADTVKQLDQAMTDLEKLVETADEQQLSKWAPTIANICTHNAYHVGQIVYVRKLQGLVESGEGREVGNSVPPFENRRAVHPFPLKYKSRLPHPCRVLCDRVGKCGPRILITAYAAISLNTPPARSSSSAFAWRISFTKTSIVF